MSARSSIEDLLTRIRGVQTALARHNLSPNNKKMDTRRYNFREVSEMVGRSHQAIRQAEQDGRLPAPELGDNNRRLGFTLAEINNIRDVFGVRLRRQPDEDPVVIGCQSYKGGSGKTTTAVHLAQFLARSGLRVLLIDCDPQASATAVFGYVPEVDIPPNRTLLPFLEGDVNDLMTAVRPTYFTGVDLVPANLDLYRAEYTLAAGPVDLARLKDGIASVWDNYDVIVIDPPPSLGLISLNALYAANAMVIPMSLGLLDFYSTVSFVQMLRDTIEIIENRVGDIQTKFVKVLMTRVDEAKPVHGELATLLEDTFGNFLLKARMRDSAAVDNAGMMMRTVYEVERTNANRKTLQRACNLFDNVNAEILELCRLTWPSHVQAMRTEGKI